MRPVVNAAKNGKPYKEYLNPESELYENINRLVKKKK